jgi:hypothetical protein
VVKFYIEQEASSVITPQVFSYYQHADFVTASVSPIPQGHPGRLFFIEKARVDAQDGGKLGISVVIDHVSPGHPKGYGRITWPCRKMRGSWCDCLGGIRRPESWSGSDDSDRDDGSHHDSDDGEDATGGGRTAGGGGAASRDNTSSSASWSVDEIRPTVKKSTRHGKGKSRPLFHSPPPKKSKKK